MKTCKTAFKLFLNIQNFWFKSFESEVWLIEWRLPGVTGRLPCDGHQPDDRRVVCRMQHFECRACKLDDASRRMEDYSKPCSLFHYSEQACSWTIIIGQVTNEHPNTQSNRLDSREEKISFLKECLITSGWPIRAKTKSGSPRCAQFQVNGNKMNYSNCSSLVYQGRVKAKRRVQYQNGLSWETDRRWAHDDRRTTVSLFKPHLQHGLW